MFYIMGRYRGKTEELDSTESNAEAKRLLSEYIMAFGAGWIIWIATDNDGSDSD